MEIVTLRKKANAIFIKYKYVALVLLVGLILMLLPNKEGESQDHVTQQQCEQIEISAEQQLATILSQIEGAGQVRVMLTVKKGELIIYQTDDNTISNADGGSSQITTVTVTTSEKEEIGLIRQKISPSYLGAIVVCEGADKPSVQLAIVEAVSKATGLGADCISVLKMK